MIPTGKGILIWQLKNCSGGDPVRLAGMAQAAGFSWVAIKAANGTADFNADLFMPAKSVLEAVGIQVWGWQYLYGANIYTGASIAKQEAEAAIRNINRYGLAGWIMDPESEYKRKGAAAWADTYVTMLRSTFPSLPIGLCSYRYPSLHPELPWHNFLRRCDFHAPQVYWIDAHNPVVQLARSWQELRSLRDLPVIPIGSAYAEHGWQPTVNELDSFDQEAHILGLPGLGWWAWDDHGLEEHPDYWQAVSAHEWGAPIPPAPPPALPVAVSTKSKYINIRNAPDLTTGSDVGDIIATKLPVVGESGEFWRVSGYVAKSITEPV
jgi:hypothetical protein